MSTIIETKKGDYIHIKTWIVPTGYKQIFYRNGRYVGMVIVANKAIADNNIKKFMSWENR